MAYDLRAWQKAAFTEWRRRWAGVVSVTTGAGKTVFALHCVEQFRSRHPKARIFVVVPTLALLDQWYVALAETHWITEGQIGIFYGGERTGVRDVNLLVLNTARNILPQISSGGAGMLVVDECHRAGSRENAKALKGTYAATLGLSATPEREYDDGFERFVMPALGPVIFCYGTAQAVSDGVIVPYDIVNIYAPLTDQEQARFDRLTAQIARLYSTDPESPRIEGLLRTRASVSGNAQARIPVAVRLVLDAQPRRVVVFHERVEAAEAIARLLAARGVNAALYHSKIPPNIRRSALQLFRRRAFQVLVTCRSLDEGLDVPDVEVAVIASSTASQRQRIQRFGRVLRGAPGKSRAMVQTIFATDVEERRLAQEAALVAEEASVTWATVQGGESD